MSDSTIKIESLIDKGVELGYNCICITDHEAISGHIRFMQHYQEGIADGSIPTNFKIGLGNEIYLLDQTEIDRELEPNEKRKYWHFILIAKDAEGHKQLRQLSTRAWTRMFREKGMERVPTTWDDLQEVIGDNKGHLIASTACLGGQFAENVVRYKRDGDSNAKKIVHRFLKRCIDIFGQQKFFLEMQPKMYIEGEPKHDQIILNQTIPQIAEVYGLRYIVTTDSHYLTKNDRYTHEAYLQSDPKNSGERELGDFYETTYVMDEEDLMKHLTSHLSKEVAETAINNTRYIYNMLESYDLSHPVIVPADPYIPADFPIEHLFADWYSECPYLEQFANSEEKQDRYLLHMIEEGFKEKEQELNAENVHRLNEELETISKVSDRLEQPVSAYYVLVSSMVRNLLWEHSFVGIARGSATGFYLSYLIGITQVNPIPYKLSAFRHLHESRPEMPDIDVDIEASKRPTIFDTMKEYYNDRSLATLTFKTLTSKSAVITACRGVGVNDDEARSIADLIPIERGAVWSINDCLNGNEDKGREKIPAFIEAMERYSSLRLKETILSLEGLITGRSIHASAQYIFSQDYIEQNSLMRAPNGTPTTAYSMTDSDTMGGLKMDLLTIKALDKMHATINVLIEEGVIEDKGSLRANYDAYLHPDTLEYNDPKLWQLMADNLVPDLFQFDSDVGLMASAKIKPTSVREMAVANALMRLQAAPGEASPIDVYCQYKSDIRLWYDEMQRAGLSTHDIEVLEPHLKDVNGVSSLQEELMLMSMDEHISGFTVAEANKLRKAIAKKKPKLMAEVKELFYKKGKERGTSQELLDYVWNRQVQYQAGYAFSINHCIPYSLIGLQELNLVYKYGPLFWNVGCLTVNAGADESNENTENTEYGKIAKAVNELRGRGQKFLLPDVNKARFGFGVDVENDAIVCSLKAINGLGDAQAEAIIANRPYKSFDGFLEATQDVIKPSHVIALIKAGAFDALDERPRRTLMKAYIATIAPTIKRLTTTNINELFDLGIIEGERFAYVTECRNEATRIMKQVAVKGPTPASTWLQVQSLDGTEDSFFRIFGEHLTEGKDYKADENGFYIVKKSALTRARDRVIAPFKEELLSNPKYLDALNEKRILAMCREKANGTIAHWEMESLLFYYGDHELDNVDRELYQIANFNSLPLKPVPKSVYQYSNGRTQTTQNTYQLVGTVLDRNKTRHTVTLLTLDGVVTLKFWKDLFIMYDKQISTNDEKGNKKILEKSWFTRGNLLMVTGYRRDEQFVVRTYRDSFMDKPVQLIEKLNQKTGALTLRKERAFA